MKKVLMLAMCLMLGTTGAYCAGECPTPEQYQAKAQEYQMKALQNMSANVSVDASIALMNDMEAYFDNVCFSCIEYFKTVKNPDCSKFNTMSASFVLLDENEKAKAKAEIDKLLLKYENSCSTYVEMVSMFVK